PRGGEHRVASAVEAAPPPARVRGLPRARRRGGRAPVRARAVPAERLGADRGRPRTDRGGAGHRPAAGLKPARRGASASLAGQAAATADCVRLGPGLLASLSSSAEAWPRTPQATRPARLP